MKEHELKPLSDEEVEAVERDARRDKGRPDRRRRNILRLIVRMRQAEAKLKEKAKA